MNRIYMRSMRVSCILFLAFFVIISYVPPTTFAEAITGANDKPQELHLMKIELYRNGTRETVQSGATIARVNDRIVLTFDRSFAHSDFITVTDSKGSLVPWTDCGCVPVSDSERTKVIVLNPNQSGPLKRNETYNIKLKADEASTYDTTSYQPVYMDTSLAFKSADVPVENSYTMNLFAQNTQPSAVASVRLIANKDTKRINVTPLHVAQGNDLRFLLVDAVTKKVFYQSTVSAQEGFNVDIPHAGIFDLLAVYHTNDYVTSELQRAPVQMTLSGQELQIHDPEIPALQFANTNPATIVGGEIKISLNIDQNAKVGVLIDGAAYGGARGVNGWQEYSLFLNAEPLKDGPHNITIFTSRPNSDNQRMISRDILINRNDSFSDVPQSHWAHDDIERLHGLGIIEGRTIGSFQPDQLVTRQEFLKMLVMTAKSEAKQQTLTFTDIPTESWSMPYIDRGSSAGLIDGEFSSGRRMFYPNRTITRLEAIAMMARTDRLSSLPQPHESIPGIEDRSTIQPWGISFVEKLFYYRWIHGYDDHTFRPDQPLTRAEAATLLTSFTKDSNFPQNEGLLGYLNSAQQWIY